MTKKTLARLNSLVRPISHEKHLPKPITIVMLGTSTRKYAHFLKILAILERECCKIPKKDIQNSFSERREIMKFPSALTLLSFHRIWKRTQMYTSGQKDALYDTGTRQSPAKKGGWYSVNFFMAVIIAVSQFVMLYSVRFSVRDIRDCEKLC